MEACLSIPPALKGALAPYLPLSQLWPLPSPFPALASTFPFPSSGPAFPWAGSQNKVPSWE